MSGGGHDPFDQGETEILPPGPFDEVETEILSRSAPPRASAEEAPAAPGRRRTGLMIVAAGLLGAAAAVVGVIAWSAAAPAPEPPPVATVPGPEAEPEPAPAPPADDEEAEAPADEEEPAEAAPAEEPKKVKKRKRRRARKRNKRHRRRRSRRSRSKQRAEVAAHRPTVDVGLGSFKDSSGAGLHLERRLERLVRKRLGRVREVNLRPGRVARGLVLDAWVQKVTKSRAQGGNLVEVSCSAAFSEEPGGGVKFNTRATAGQGVGEALTPALTRELAEDALARCVRSMARDLARFARRRAR